MYATNLERKIDDKQKIDKRESNFLETKANFYGLEATGCLTIYRMNWGIYLTI